MEEKKEIPFENMIADSKSLSDLSGELCGKAGWYYPRGINSQTWRKKYFYKYGKWIWTDELLEADISRADIILCMLKPMTTPFLTLLGNKKGDAKYSF